MTTKLDNLRSYIIDNRSSIVTMTVDRFDLKKTQTMMHAVKWSYWDEPHPIPLYRLQQVAVEVVERLLDEVLRDDSELTKTHTVMTGGIRATYDYYPGYYGFEIDLIFEGTASTAFFRMESLEN